jgi:hypothetical protein
VLFCCSALGRDWHKADGALPDEANIADLKFGRDPVAKMSRFKNLALTMLPKELASV